MQSRALTFQILKGHEFVSRRPVLTCLSSFSLPVLFDLSLPSRRCCPEKFLKTSDLDAHILCYRICDKQEGRDLIPHKTTKKPSYEQLFCILGSFCLLLELLRIHLWFYVRPTSNTRQLFGFLSLWTKTFFGRPPRLPLVRLACCFLRERDLPPIFPSATALGFLVESFCMAWVTVNLNTWDVKEKNG